MVRRHLAVVLLALSGYAAAQLDVASTYTKTEVMIPMRDGVRLFTSIYAPKDTSKAYPLLITRTPYSCRPYGPAAYRNGLGANPDYAKEGFVFVYQDVRGRYKSEGEFADIRPQLPVLVGPSRIDESTDTYDTIDWLVEHVPNNNGRAGLIGISYPGFYAAVGMIDSHPALKCSSPQAPVSEWFMGDDFHHNGAFFVMDCFNFYNGFGRPRPEPTENYPPGWRNTASDAYKFFLDIGPLSNIEKNIFKGDVAFWTELMKHPNYDAWWQARSLPNHVKNVKCAVMTVGGLYDAEDLYGALAIYRGVEKLNPGIENGIVMGPWTHGAWAGPNGDRLGDQEFGAKTSPEYQRTIELPFLRKYLKQEGDFKLKEAVIFETGANRFHQLDAWPPAEAKPATLYLGADGGLSFTKPTLRTGFDEYVSDPAHPVPYVDGTTYGRPSEYMNADQRFASRRPDVLTYRSEPLTEAVRLAGPLKANLFVSMTGTDADFVVKLIDEFPADEPRLSRDGPVWAGYQMMVRGEIMRGRFRKSFEHPEAFTPGKVEAVSYTLPDVCHTFKPGHRIVVQVQSSWFPLADRNPQTFVPSIYEAKASDFKKATIQVHRSASNPSGLEVLVWK